MIVHAVAAYGRKYMSKAAIEKDWNDNKDFLVYGGGYVNKQDLKPGDSINIRYNNNRSVAVFKVK